MHSLILAVSIFGLQSAHALNTVEVNSFDRKTQDRLYSLSTGGRLLPFDWFEALVDVDTGLKLSDPKVLHDELGFSYSPRNPQTIPVGVTRTRINKNYSTPFDLRGEFMGFNCVACHTGELYYKGTRMMIEGGSGRVDIEGFISKLRRSLSNTYLNVIAFNRFWPQVRTGLWRLYPAVAGFSIGYESVAPIAKVKEGPGRSDTVSKGGSTFAYYVSSNRTELDSPVSIPSVWGSYRFSSYHVSGSILQPLGRDISATIGGGAAIDLRRGRDQFDSSMNLDSMYEFQLAYRDLKAPVWPEKILGKINRRSAKLGKTIYEKNCAECHSPQTKNGLLDLKLVELDEIGTDPNAALKMGNYRVDTGSVGLGTLPAYSLFEEITSYVQDYKLSRMDPTRAKLYRGDRENVWRAPKAYKANPLDGIWATPPYLHNGSVPNLKDLLQDPSERIVWYKMCVDTEYDPDTVGYRVDEDRSGCTVIDTRVSGNRNTGHLYGTDLSSSEKDQLLEYLKTL